MSKFDRSQEIPDNELLTALRGKGRKERAARLETQANVRSMKKPRQAQEFAEGLDGYQVAMHANPETFLKLIEKLQKEATEAEILKIENAEKTFQDTMEIAQEALEEGITPKEMLQADTYVEETSPKERKLATKLLKLLQKVESPFQPKPRTILMRRAIATAMVLMIWVAACTPTEATQPPTEKPRTELPVELPPAEDPATEPAPSTDIAAAPTEIAMQATSLDAVAIYRDPIYQVGPFTIWKVRDGVDSPYSADMVFMESPFVGKEGEILFIDVSNFAEEVPGVTHVGIGTKNGNTVVTGLNSSGQVIGYVGYDASTGTASYARATAADNIQANVEKGYFELTPAEQLLQSQGNVERATTYDGDVMFTPDIEGGEQYPSYWSPTAPTQYGLNGNGSWVSAHNTPDSELDKKGDSFPPIAIQGRENLDGSLVMIDPNTGAEVTFGKIYVPGFGETTMKELYAMHNQDELGRILVDSLLSNSNISPEDKWYQIADASPLMSVYLPGFRYGKQTNFYSTLSGAGSGGNEEIPEKGWMYYEVPTNSFAIPIPSPETDALMFFLNIQQGNMASTLTIKYSEKGSSFFDTVSNKSPDSFGYDSQNRAGILIENREAWRSHSAGGAKPLLQGGEGIGDITDIERILNASTEQEILDIIGEFRIFVSSPFEIVFPE